MRSDNTVALPAVRVPPGLLSAVRHRCAALDLSISQGVRRALREWLAKGPQQTDLEDLIAAVEPQASSTAGSASRPRKPRKRS